MKIKSFEWIYHGKKNKKPISVFSIDIQPFNELFLTAGQDSIIKIWKTIFIFKKKNPLRFDNSQKKNILNNEIKIPSFVLHTHQGQVNIIRWSLDGSLFASGGDDGFLIIYEKVKNPIQKTMWRIFQTFRSHTGDIVDLAWTPNNSFLASASLDNNILIWSLDSKSLIIKLSGHSTWVKGVSWDSTGKFLASHGADHKIFLWDTNSWQLTKIINLEKKFIKSQINKKVNLFSRSFWSTCGDYLIICNTFYKKKSSILIFSRIDGFKKLLCIVGKNFLTRAIRCSPRLYRNLEDQKIYSFFSSGSTEGKINLLNPSLYRTSIQIKNIKKNQITDMTWAACGYRLFVSFLDGTTAGIQFEEKEIGKILKKQEHFEFLRNYFLKFGRLKIDKNIIFTSKIFLRKKNLIQISNSKKTNFFDYLIKRTKNKCLARKNPKFQIIFRRKLKQGSSERFFYFKNLSIFQKNIFFPSDKKQYDSNLINFFSKKKKKKFFLCGKNEVKISFFKFFFVKFIFSNGIKSFLNLILRKKSYRIRNFIENSKKILKISSKIFFFTFQENFLKIFECDGYLRIIEFKNFMENKKIKLNLFSLDKKQVKNFLINLLFLKSSGLYFF
ncbi:hira (nucleomorph) [Hemiselmis andersenii]|uniref:Hira n=1 Tax=Hemiselmis andersenii TaxID=464988 RepID=A9BKS7_HEMAN|nr:hira [Hemiselmis andersenii]ABW98082.1 hira [Hemiselmis andersenii]